MHDTLPSIRDGEDDPALVSGGFQVEHEGKLSIKWVWEVGACQLARIGIRSKDKTRGVVWSVDLGDLTWRRISNQL